MSNTISFIKKKFSNYYKDVDLYLPDRFGKREWGFMFFEGGFMQRHLAFQSTEKIRQFLVQKVPAHVYHSSAYYDKPNAPTMDEKNWLGADLIFDLDADHIKGAKYMTYEETLAKVKEEFQKLIDDFLLSDFGFEEKQLMIVFSGGRGYHIHIRDPKVLQLTSHERREIVDYITGRDLDMEWIFPKEIFDSTTYGKHINIKYKVKMPEPGIGGWKKKMREGIKRFTHELENMGEEEAIKRLTAFEGIGKKTAKGIYSELYHGNPGTRGMDKIWEEENLEVFSQDKLRNAFLSIIKGETGVRMKVNEGEEKDLVEILSVKDKLEGETDEPVTSDIKRLIRLPSSLHGKTGFKVIPLKKDDLDDFEPLRDALPESFSDSPVKVHVVKPVKIRLRNDEFDLKEGETEVPEFAAIFLACRKSAEILI